MDMPQPQRPARSATASTPSTHNYNDFRAIEQWVRWADDSGVIAPSLKVGQWVQTNAPQCAYGDKSLKVMLANGSVRVVDTRTGNEHTFTGLSPEVVA